MLLNEIVNLNLWIAGKEKNFQPIVKLQKLKSILDENSQARPQNNRAQPALQPFTDEKKAAIESLRQYRLSELSNDQIACLSVHGADTYMGDVAANHLNEIFRNEMHDLAYLAKEVTETHSALNTAMTKINEASTIVAPYSAAISEAEYLDEKARFSIIFKDGVKVDSLNDLEARSKEWGIIMHGIGVALDVPPNEFKVLGARNGSFVIDLFMCAAAIIPLGFILNRSLDIIERFAISLKRIESIYELELDDPAFQKLEEQIKATNEEYFNLKKLVSAKKIAKEILDEKGCPNDKRAEAETFLESSIKKILNHLRKGGDLDAFVPGEENNEAPDASQESEAASLIEKFRHKKLELSQKDLMKLLENFDFEDEPEE
jgi:hypothetical protein